MSDRPKFCIVVAINHSVENLKLCLESLTRLDYPRDGFTVVTVDYGGVPGMEEFAANGIASYGLPLTHLALPPGATPVPEGVPEARMNESRNLAVARCPAECYVFTEDDVSLDPDWLRKVEARLNERTGALGAPDRLPPGMGPLADALDILLNSAIGSPGRLKTVEEHDFCPRKDCFVIPARVLARTGPWPEKLFYGGELEMTRAIRALGLDVKCMSEAPIWHRRVTSFGRFLQRNVEIARERTRVLRRQGRFARSAHAMLLIASLAAAALAIAAFFYPPAARVFLGALAFCAILVLALSIRTLTTRKSPLAALWVIALATGHLASVACGVFAGLSGVPEDSTDGHTRE